MQLAPDYSILVPWLSNADWTNVLAEYFSKLLSKYFNVNIIYGNEAANKEFGWLEAKIEFTTVVFRAWECGKLGKHIIIVDPNYLNIRALRSLMDKDGKIFTLVNGGAFQPFDLEQQYSSKHILQLQKYEEGFFTLCDHVIAASEHSRKLILNSCKIIENIKVIPYPLRSVAGIVPIAEKRGMLFAGRKSYEKGIDLINQVNLEGNGFINILSLMDPRDYIAELDKHRALILPARAELFGYCAIEALQVNTIPLVPKGLAYEEYIYLPEELYLSFPVGKHTVQEITRISKFIAEMDDFDYQAVITQAQAHLKRKILGQDAKFEELLYDAK